MDQAALEHIRGRLREFQVGDQFTLKVLWGNAWEALETGEKLRLGKAFKASFANGRPFRGEIEPIEKTGSNHRLYRKL